jgi:hypothetical protein
VDGDGLESGGRSVRESAVVLPVAAWCGSVIDGSQFSSFGLRLSCFSKDARIIVHGGTV